eukprot:901341-Rhodomonas_salina.1
MCIRDSPSTGPGTLLRARCERGSAARTCPAPCSSASASCTCVAELVSGEGVQSRGCDVESSGGDEEGWRGEEAYRSSGSVRILESPPVRRCVSTSALTLHDASAPQLSHAMHKT